MIITTLIYAAFVLMLAISKHKIKTANINFGSAEVARYAALVANKEIFIIGTIIYVLIMVVTYAIS